MVKTGIVFFDGISGSGKSTTSQLIYLDLLSKGYDAKWYYEHEFPHPIVSLAEIDGAIKTALPWEQVASQIDERAIAMVEEGQGSNRIMIVESCPYQIVAGYLFRMNIGRNEIIEWMSQFEERFTPLHPMLIYFHQNDVGHALRKICAKRGDGFDQYLLDRFAETPYGKAHSIHDFESLEKAYCAFREITDELTRISKMRVLSFETDREQWDAIQGKIAMDIGAGAYQGPARPTRGLNVYAGQYKEQESGHLWSIAADEKGLFFDDEYRVRLYVWMDDVFLIEGATVELHFDVNDAGAVESIRCGGNVVNDPIIGSVWEKVK